MADNIELAKDHKNQGNSFFNQREYEQAIACYSKAISLDPANPVYLLNRAACCLPLKKYEMVIEDTKQAAHIIGSKKDQTEDDKKLLAKAYMRQGDAHKGKSDERRAKVCYMASLSIHESADVKKKLEMMGVPVKKAETPAKTPPTPPPKPANLYAKMGAALVTNSAAAAKITAFDKSHRDGLVALLSAAYVDSAPASKTGWAQWFTANLAKVGDAADLTKRFCSSPQGGIWVAVVEGKVVGAVCVLPLSGEDAEVRHLVVAKDVRRQGLARKLLAQAEGHCAKHGVNAMHADVLEHMTSAAAVFGKSGYTTQRTADGVKAMGKTLARTESKA